MTKVLIIGSNLDFSEAHLLVGLKESGLSVDALLSPDSRMAQIIEEGGVQCKRIEFRSRIDISAIFQLRRIIKKGQYEILHCLTGRAVSNAIAASIGLPTKIIAYRGVTHRDSKWSPESWITFLNPRVRKVICNSDAVYDFMSTVTTTSKLVRIYKGFDVNWYSPKQDIQLSKFGIPDGAFVVACVATMRPGKGIPYLLAAIKELGAESKVHLLLIGDLKSGVDVSLLKDPIVASKVHLIGFQTDVGSIVAKCNAAVMASERREGLCKSVIESMSVGVPTIVTAIGGMKEIVSNERDGLIIEPRSSQAISAAINKLIQDPKRAQEFGVAGRETIVKKFGLPRAIRETIAVYDEVLTS